MAKKEIDYSKVKAMAQSILECIGDDQDTGEHPDVPKSDANPMPETNEFGIDDNEDGGQDPQLDFIGNELADGKDEQGETPDEDDSSKKKKKDSSLALMGSVLASKFNGKGNQA